MAPTALTSDPNLRSNATAAAGGEPSSKSKLEPKVTPKKPHAPSKKDPLKPPQKSSDDDRLSKLARRRKHPLSVGGEGYKELAVSAGRLGLTLQLVAEKRGVVVRAIDPACTFRDKIQVGDRIVKIDGREITDIADVQVGKERLRIFGIVSKGQEAPPAKTETGIETTAAPTTPALEKDKALLTAVISNLGKRKRDEKGNNNNNNNNKSANKTVRIRKWPKYYPLQTDAFLLKQRQREEFDAWHRYWNIYQKDLTNHCRARHADGWEQRYQELIRFKDENDGDCNNVPLKYRDPDDLALGEWAELQRELYREDMLDADRVDCLMEQGFDFDYTPPPIEAPPIESFTGNERWDAKMRELIEYKEKNTDCNVPINYPVEETLPQWVHNQRKAYNGGTLDEDRHVILEEKGFVFEPGTNVEKTVIDEAWKEKYQQLAQFKRDHGHLEVPGKYRANSLSSYLGSWVRKQRKAFKQNELSRNRITLLKELGLDLSRRTKAPLIWQDGQWDAHYKELVLFIEQHGNINIPRSARQLQDWASNQRYKFRQGKLTERRVQRLREIGFDLSPLNKDGEEESAEEEVVPPPKKESIFDTPAWMGNYYALNRFTENNGHADVPLDYKDDNIEGSLHTWIETQKRFFEKGSLPQQNIEALEGLQVNLSKKYKHTASRHDVAWMTNFEALKRFHEENGHTDVPANHAVDGIGGNRSLLKWNQKQRQMYKKNMLTEQRISLLESLGIVLSGRKRHNVYLKLGLPLGEMPDDNLWFEHGDGIRRRVPRTWKFPNLNFEEMYVIYHCQHHLEDKESKLSPMKMFEASDMVNRRGDSTSLRNVRLICGIVDQECRLKGVAIKGIMTEEEARRCIRIGSTGLNIPEDVLPMSWYTVKRLKNPEGRYKVTETNNV